MSRDIDIAEDEVNQVYKCLNRAEPAGAISHDADDAIHSLRNGIGQSRFYEGDDVFAVFSNGMDELANWLESALERCSSPALQEVFGLALVGEIPEQVELILQDTGAMDAMIPFPQLLDEGLVFRGTLRNMFKQEPPESLEGLSFVL